MVKRKIKTFIKRSGLKDRAARASHWLKLRLSQGRLQANSAEFKDLFPANAKIKRVTTGFQFTEGPIWFTEGGYLLFSDIPASKIYKLTPAGQVSVYRDPSHNANGLTCDKQDRLIACEHGTRRVTRTEKDGSITVLADQFEGKKLNSPNDVVVKSDGAIYFTDPPYGIKPDQQEQPVQGVYRILPGSQTPELLVDDFDHPNGLAFSPDESRLYIDDSSLQRRHIRVFAVQPDGRLSGGELFCDMNIPQPGVPDGMKVDRQGHIFSTGPGGIWVLDAEGHHLGTIVTPEEPANCAWGDEDWCTLYITARTAIYRIRVKNPGISVP